MSRCVVACLVSALVFASWACGSDDGDGTAAETEPDPFANAGSRTSSPAPTPGNTAASSEPSGGGAGEGSADAGAPADGGAHDAPTPTEPEPSVDAATEDPPPTVDGGTSAGDGQPIGAVCASDEHCAQNLGTAVCCGATCLLTEDCSPAGYLPCEQKSDCDEFGGGKVCCETPAMRFCTKQSACSGTPLP